MSKKTCSICRKVVVSTKHDVLQTYICSVCEEQKAYSICNVVRKGKSCTFPAFSLEFEIGADKVMRRRALILLRYQFERAYDATVSDEYKSPIYQNLHVFRKPLAVLHDLRDLVDDRCGTHLHVSFAYKRVLSSIRQEVFGPLIAYLLSNEKDTIVFWGRTFCDHAQSTLYHYERHVAINTWSRHETIEYRLPRFRSADQYLAVVRFCRNITKFLEWHLNPAHDLYRTSKPLTPDQIGNQVLDLYKKSYQQFAMIYLKV